MSEIYTRDDLDGMSRVELRRLAVQVHGMDNRECVNTRSEEIKEYVLEKQSGGGGSKPSSKGRSGKTSKASSSKKGSSKPASRGSSKSKDEEGTATAALAGDFRPLLDAVDALGKTFDENAEATKESMAELGDQVAELDKKMFFLNGLVADVYKGTFDPEDLDARLEELEAEYNAEGNEGGEGE